MEAAGIERSAPMSQAVVPQADAALQESASALCLQRSGSGCRLLALNDPLLSTIVELWPGLPADARRAVYMQCAALDEQPSD